MMKNRTLIYLTALLFANGAVYAQSQQIESYSLDKCISEALKNNYGIIVAGNNLEIAKNNVTPAPFLPDLNMTARQTQNDTRQSNFVQSGSREETKTSLNNMSVGFTLNWRLFDGLGMFAERARQKELLSNEQLYFRVETENLVMKLTGQYYLIVSLQSQVKLFEESLSISQTRYNHAFTRYKIGKDSGLEFKQAKIYLNSDSSRLLQLRENVKNAYLELYRLMNKPLDSKISIVDTIIPDHKLELERLLAASMDQNSSILLANNGADIKFLDLELAKAERYPKIDFVAGYNRALNESSLFPDKYNLSNGASWGFTLTLPIFTGNEINRKVKNARIARENAKIEVLDVRSNVENQVRQMYNNYKYNFRQIDFENENKETASLNLDAAMEKYRLGALAGIEFRDIQLSYLDASDRRLKAIYQAKISEITLKLLSGELFK